MAFRDGLTGVSESDRLKVFKLVFQEEGAEAFAALFNDGPEVLEKAVASLQNVAGRAEKQASVLLDNLDGDVKKLAAARAHRRRHHDRDLAALRRSASCAGPHHRCEGGRRAARNDPRDRRRDDTAGGDGHPGQRPAEPAGGADGTGGLGAGVDAAMNYFGTGSSRMGAGRSGEGGDVVEDFARSLGGIFTGGDFGGPFRFLGKEIAGRPPPSSASGRAATRRRRPSGRCRRRGRPAAGRPRPR